MHINPVWAQQKVWFQCTASVRMDADIFSQLTGGGGFGGIRFDKKKFSKDFEAFKPKLPQPVDVGSTARAWAASGKATAQDATSRGMLSDSSSCACADCMMHRICQNLSHAGTGDGTDDDADIDEALVIDLFDAAAGEESKEGSDGSGGDSDAEAGDDEPAGSGGGGRPGEVDASCPRVTTHDVNEEANVIRKAFRIKVAGTDLPCPLRSFAELHSVLRTGRRLLQNLRACGYSEPTPIQRQAIPTLMAARELLAVAPTGEVRTCMRSHRQALTCMRSHCHACTCM